MSRKKIKKPLIIDRQLEDQDCISKQDNSKQAKHHKNSSIFDARKQFVGAADRSASDINVNNSTVPMTRIIHKPLQDTKLMKLISYTLKSSQTLKNNTDFGGIINKFLPLNLKSICNTKKASCNKGIYHLYKSIFTLAFTLLLIAPSNYRILTADAQTFDPTTSLASVSSGSSDSISSSASSSSATSCFGGLQTFEKISMSTFESPSTSSTSSSSFGGGILVQQDDQALTSECVNLCRSQSNCLSFVIDYNKFECKSYATTQQELQQEFDAKFSAARSTNSSSIQANGTESHIYLASASTVHFQHLLPSASSNYFEKICLDGVANKNQFNDVCGQGRLWTIERVVDTFLDGFVEKEVTNVNNKDECSKLCIFEGQFVCRSADFDQHSRLCRLSKEDRRTQPQAMRHVAGSNRQYLENQCATPGPSSCVYETKKNYGIISMDALKFAQTFQDCQMKCNQESTFNCRSYSFYQQRCFLSGDDSTSLNSNLIKLPIKQSWQFGEKKCLVELCTKGIFSYEKITGYTLRSALSTPIELMLPSNSIARMAATTGRGLDEIERLQHESSQTRSQHLAPIYFPRLTNSTSNLVTMMMMAASNSNPAFSPDPMHESASSVRHQRSSSNNLAITDHCRHSCDLGYLNCPAFTIDYKNNRCQRLDRNSQGRHHELVAREGFAYYEKICLRVPEIMSMCQDKYWIFERVIGYELAPRLYEKSLKFVQSRRDCEEYCLEEKQFQCRSALYNDETSDCKLSRYDRRLIINEGGYYRNFNPRISYLENQCIRDHSAEQQCTYDLVKDEPSYPTFTEHIEIVQQQQPNQATTGIERESVRKPGYNMTRLGSAYCEQLCNDNAKFECHSFGYYASTAQCFLSGDDSVSAGETAATPSTGFIYFEKKCRPTNTSGGFSNHSVIDDATRSTTPTSSDQSSLNPYIRPTGHYMGSSTSSPIDNDMSRPVISNNNISIHYDQRVNISRHQKPKPPIELTSGTNIDSDQYKCGFDHSFVYQRISGFEPIGGYKNLLIKNNDQPGIVAECSEQCKRAYECRGFVVDYNNNECHAMLENSSIGLLSLRQTLGKDYFEGFCIANHILLPGHSCKNKTWVIDKIVDQAVIGVQHQKIIPDSDRAQCRQACLEERLFWCKSAMFDDTTRDCKLYSIDRESMPQMRLLFTKGVDFFENQCQIVSNSCPYDAIERDMTIVTVTKSIQARSTFDCEQECNSEVTFNCRSYTYLDQYPSLPNMCLLSSDSRSTSQKGSVREHSRTLYAERNCYYRRPRYPGAMEHKPESMYISPQHSSGYAPPDPYQYSGSPGSQSGLTSSDNDHNSPKLTEPVNPISPTIPSTDLGISLGQNCAPHQYTFERTFGYDYRLGQKERAPIPPTIGIAIGCQQECLRRGDRCQSFVVEYALPYQSCFLIDTQVGANRKMLVKSPNSAYFEKICLPRTGVDVEQLTHSPLSNAEQADMQLMDIAPSYSHEPWSPQVPSQLPYYLQQQQLVQNYPSRSCAKLWSFERFINHNFTATNDKILENIINRAQCETNCLNEASFSCRAATYEYANKICRLYKNTRRTIMSQFVDLESLASSSTATSSQSSVNMPHSLPGTAHVLTDETELAQSANSPMNIVNGDNSRRQASSRQLSTPMTTAEAPIGSKNIDYMENTCVPEPSSCQYRQLYDVFNLYIDKINHAVSLNDCQRQCDLERLFSCKSINYDPASRNCMLINEDLISLNRGQQASLLPKKNTIYSEKGNCEMISVQCNSQEMMVSINFDSPFKGRVMAKGNPEQCYLIGDGQTSIQFPIVFGPKCNSRQEGHNTFVNEVVIQQHPIIMTDSDKVVRVMCAFEAPDQTITLKNPSSRDNKTGIDVGTPESSRTRHDKQHFNPVISNKAAPPSVLLRILDQNGRDAAMINLGDDLVLKIQMQVDGQNSALGIFARNLAARSSSGESLLLIDNDGCPVDHQVFPALEIDPKDGKSLYSTFKAFRFPSSGLVNFEVQIRFCPERCQPVECNRGQRMRSYGRKKREALEENAQSTRISILQSTNPSSIQRNPIEELSTVMKPGKAFQFVRELLLNPQPLKESPNRDLNASITTFSTDGEDKPLDGPEEQTNEDNETLEVSSAIPPERQEQPISSNLNNESLQPNAELQPSHPVANEFVLNYNNPIGFNSRNNHPNGESDVQSSFQKSILMHVDEKVVPSTTYGHPRALNQPHSPAPYGRYPISEIEQHHKRQNLPASPTIGVLESKPSQTSEQTGLINSQEDYASNMNSSPDESLDQQHNRQNEDSSPVRPPNEIITTESPSMNDSASRMVKISGLPHKEIIKTDDKRSKDLPLRFSILVGENQGTNRGWIPSEPSPVLIMNSTSVDHIVIPGKNGQFEHISTSDTKNYAVTNNVPTTESSSASESNANFQSYSDIRAGEETTKKSILYEQTFDVLPSNSVEAEIKLNHPSTQSISSNGIIKTRQSGSPSETAASHDCQVEAGSNRLWTIIWTGTFVIALNICLVVLSLILYFKKVHFRQNHNIVRATSECGTHSPTGRYRWPSVLLKSKNNLGTSLNTHEHFFCKLNSKSNSTNNGANTHEYNWPNLSSSSTHSTISSMASPLPVTNIRINQTRPHIKPTFDSHSSLRGNFTTGHKSVLEVNSYEGNVNYLDNIDESHPDSFQPLR